MRTYKKALEALQKSQYIQPVFSHTNEVVERAKLLQNGKIFQKHLLKQLQVSHPKPDHYDKLIICESKDCDNGTSLLNSNEFQTNYNEILKKFNKIQKSYFLSNTLIERQMPLDESNFLDVSNVNPRLLFVSDYFVHSSRRLETFYNIQRERKIWWMRYSSDPSRYTVNTHDIDMENNQNDNSLLSKCQSIKISNEFPFCKFDVEHITLLALTEIENYENLPDLSVIRSNVNIDIATYALLLNSISHATNEALLLHRQLSPFQLMIVQNTEEKNNEADDLCSHIVHVFRRAGLRVIDRFPHAHHTDSLKYVLSDADKLGVNYTIIINDDTLVTGRFYLRNRDTGLCETIHISDLPTYLVNILSC